MNKNEWKSLNDAEFDDLLENGVSDLPPENIVAGVTPWKKAMNRVLTGMALSTITLNFLSLNYILPASGLILSVLGFRALRRENRWFRACFIIAIIRAFYFLSLLILNTTIYHSSFYSSSIGKGLNIVYVCLLFVLVFCLRGGLLAVQKKADLPPHAGSAAALIVWCAFVWVLALSRYNGVIIGIAMIVSYIFIICSLFRLSKELDEAGYAVRTVPAKVSDLAVIISIAAVIVSGCACGYLFWDKYDMAWESLKTQEDSELRQIRSALAELGFPERILNDMSEEDIYACRGAVRVLTDVKDHPVSNDTARDEKELRITGIAVEISGEQETWRIIQHFEWTADPGFFGTESIRLMPAYNYEGWAYAGEMTGRVLYDKAGFSFTAPYHFLGEKAYTPSGIAFSGESSFTDVFASFSFPDGGERQRGYVSYPVSKVQDGWIAVSWFNYTHQIRRFQYPVMTATEKRLTDEIHLDEAFFTIQDAVEILD